MGAEPRDVLADVLVIGGGPNSSWAIASGSWAGRAAAAFAARIGARLADRPGGAEHDPTFRLRAAD